MQITLNITEDSKVELVKDDCELVQGECCFTDFVFNFPQTIKGYAISEYYKTIEFAECKDLGECVKFVDEIKGNTYELEETCTAFKKIMVQIVLERIADGKKITWKTIPFTLEFTESVNANGQRAIQTQLLSLASIQNEWKAFVKASCLRMVYSSANIPLTNAGSEGDTIFYLGDNSGDFIYGHYYRCVNIDDTCVWQDLTQDPSLEGVANGIREINKNRAIQLFVGNASEIYNANKDGDTIFIPEDLDAVEEIKEILDEAAGENGHIQIGENKFIPISNEANGDFAKTLTMDDNGVMKYGEFVVPYMQHIPINLVVYNASKNMDGYPESRVLLENPASGTYEILMWVDYVGYVIEKFYIPPIVTGEKGILSKKITSGSSDYREVLFEITLKADLALKISNEGGLDITVISLTRIVDGRECAGTNGGEDNEGSGDDNISGDF